MSTAIPYLYTAIGGLLFLYFITLWIYCGRIPAFGWFWPFTGTFMATIGLFTMNYNIAGPDGVTTLFFDENLTVVRSFCTNVLPFIMIILLALFICAVYRIYTYGKKLPSKNGDYLIILGAHVNGTIPSKALMSRIKAAFEYMKENPSTNAVLTGGQGRGENITEAHCMKQELLKLGIEESRLLMEDKSTTTEENITFAKRIIKDASIIIVTNDFHALRGSWIAKKAGFPQVESLGTNSSSIMKPHYYTREILSWIKLGIVSIIRK